MLNTNLNRGSRARRRGVTLIEVAMVLALAAVVAALAMISLNNANNNQKLTSATQQITQVQQAVQGLYAGQSSKTGLAASQIVQSLPASMVSGNTIRNPYNGVVEVAAVDAGYTVRMTNVPLDACQRLATADMGRQTQALSIGTNSHTSLPVSPATAASQCTNGISLTWTFY